MIFIFHMPQADSYYTIWIEYSPELLRKYLKNGKAVVGLNLIFKWETFNSGRTFSFRRFSSELFYPYHIDYVT